MRSTDPRWVANHNPGLETVGRCENLAMVGLIVGLLVRHLEDSGDLLDPYITDRPSGSKSSAGCKRSQSAHG